MCFEQTLYKRLRQKPRIIITKHIMTCLGVKMDNVKIDLKQAFSIFSKTFDEKLLHTNEQKKICSVAGP